MRVRLSLTSRSKNQVVSKILSNIIYGFWDNYSHVNTVFIVLLALKVY